MTIDILKEIHKDLFRENFNKYTRKAFQMLPEMDKPRILDIGCGSGAPTMELASLSNGQIIGLDVDQSSLDELNKKIEKVGLSDRVRTVRCSMFEIDFANESFDIIWAEGSISTIGFKSGLMEWRRFLKTNGFLVVHDDIENITDKLKQIPGCGYVPLGHFLLPEDVWCTEYYEPLEKRINELRTKYSDNPKAHKILDKEQQEIDMVKKNPEKYGSMFFVMQKK
ncbi:class I SAM-dependent methyltransferase [candidate division WOR-3 bacterium]|nr:class I SAM-dependent methyltransferase [candidate division WOR-3 bacterium]